ncbi:hypothetical protein [Salinigranum sp. GCM10025319]|uniref:hypothetical protein n=1 Tax=Salinigranum sp. GCM10025319 TaxID=3252687 RepID=UPI0036146E84
MSAGSSVQNLDGPRERFLYWLLLDGNRIVIAGGLVAAVVAVILTAVFLDLVAIGPASTASTMFASGLVSGTVTLVTIALSINQLILSRVFGSPDELRNRLDGTRELRDRVRERAGESSVPNDPAEFLELTAATLCDRAERLRAELDGADWEPPSEVMDYVRNVGEYGENIGSKVESRTKIVNVLGVVLGTEYAQHLTATEHLRNEYAGRLPEGADAELAAIDELLESIAITRQFFKTLSLQQDFGRLSRVLAYSGLAALVASLLLALVYRTNSVTVPARFLPLVVGAGVAVVVTPLAVFIAYVLRAATIARRTVSVGPFVPPEERSEDGSG